MTRLLGSLTNRIFLAAALLAVATIGMAVFVVNSVVTAQAERELTAELTDTSTLVGQFQQLTETHLRQQARLVADLPKLKAALAVNHGPTLAPLAADYRQQLGAAAVVLTGRGGNLLARDGIDQRTASALLALPSLVQARNGTEGAGFLAHHQAVYFVVTTPVWIDPSDPEVLGTLSIVAALDTALALRLRAFTGSDLAFTWEGRVHATTRPARDVDALDHWLGAQSPPTVRLGGEDYMTRVMPLPTAEPAEGRPPVAQGVPGVVLLRSRTEHLRFLATLHTALFATALAAVLIATVLSYVVARTITRPIRAVTAAMHEMEATGAVAMPSLPPTSSFDDEDARGLAQTFASMTAAITRFQQEATQRERLSSLGRLSTVIAHEIRNPLMIIKTALRTLRRSAPGEARATTAVDDIDEEVARLNRLVNDVLDFAKPIRFDIAPVDMRTICEGAALAAMADGTPPRVDVVVPAVGVTVETDGERLRAALVNLLDNARQSVAAAGTARDLGDLPPVVLEAHQPAADRVVLVVHDQGAGISATDLPRIFDPFFTTRRTGSGLGLAIVRNVIEGLGGQINVESRPSEGTTVTIELPRRHATPAHPVSA